jgi:hypothetical protein
MKPRCGTCRHYTPPDIQSGLCRQPLSKRGTFVSCQDKPVRPEYGCIHHEPRRRPVGTLFACETAA